MLLIMVCMGCCQTVTSEVSEDIHPFEQTRQVAGHPEPVIETYREWIIARYWSQQQVVAGAASPDRHGASTK